MGAGISTALATNAASTNRYVENRVSSDSVGWSLINRPRTKNTSQYCTMISGRRLAKWSNSRSPKLKAYQSGKWTLRAKLPGASNNVATPIAKPKVYRYNRQFLLPWRNSRRSEEHTSELQ